MTAKAATWKDLAARLAAAIPRERLDPAVLAWADGGAGGKRIGVRRGPWSVAFSGGADSLALLLVVWAHWPTRRRGLRALHFDHRLRGKESRADAVFCRRVCRALGVKFIAGRWTRALAKTAAPAPSRPGVSEAEARAARHAFFREHARVLWLGHQQDDIAETMLMRLARGSGTGGLAAPRPVQVHTGGRIYLRPLLTLKKAEIVAALKSVGAEWREDSTNAAGHYFRNRVRLDVLPTWIEAAQRDALAGAARSRLLLEEDDTALEAWLDELSPLDRKGRLDVAALRGRPRGLLRRALHRWALVQRHPIEISRQAFEALLETLEAGRATRQSMGVAGFAVTDGTHLWFQPAGKHLRKFQRGIN